MKTTRTLRLRSARLAAIVPFAALLCGSPVFATPAFLGLGTAQSFAVLGATPNVTNTDATTLTGNLGVSPAASITGKASITVNGTDASILGNPSVHEADAVAGQAQADALTAYNSLKGKLYTLDLTGEDLGSLGISGNSTLAPGVYNFGTTAELNGVLTLDFGATPDALFVFQIGTALTTASASEVDVLGGGANSGIYWLMGVHGGSGTGSATLGSSTMFAGNILALDSITLDSTATILCGRAIALNATVTMIGNTISNDCNVDNGGTGRSDYGSGGFSGSGGGAASVPEPPSALLLLMGLIGATAALAVGRRAKPTPVTA